MKNVLCVAITISIFFTTLSLSAQGNSEDLKKLICSFTWQLKSSVEKGKTKYYVNENENYILKFDLNHTYKSVKAQITENGKWVFDKEKNQLNLREENSKSMFPLAIVKATLNELILELKIQENRITMKFEPETK